MRRKRKHSPAMQVILSVFAGFSFAQLGVALLITHLQFISPHMGVA